MSNDPSAGGCLCGRVRYRVAGEPTSADICHCISCRKASGAQSVAWLTFPLERFSFVSDAPAEYRSSDEVSRTFCEGCGTSLTYRHARDQAYIDVTAASLDLPNEFPPTRHIWLEDKVTWESVYDGLAQFERGGSPG